MKRRKTSVWNADNSSEFICTPNNYNDYSHDSIPVKYHEIKNTIYNNVVIPIIKPDEKSFLCKCDDPNSSEVIKDENSKELEQQTSQFNGSVTKSQFLNETSFLVESKETKNKPKISKFMGYLFGFNK